MYKITLVKDGEMKYVLYRDDLDKESVMKRVNDLYEPLGYTTYNIEKARGNELKMYLHRKLECGDCDTN